MFNECLEIIWKTARFYILNSSFKIYFVWEVISSLRHSVSSLDETPRSWSKILSYASYFQLSSRCFIWWWSTASRPWYITSTLCWIPTIVFNTSNMTELNGKSGKKGKTSLVFTKKNSPRRTYLLPVVALRIANQDFCARLVISRIAQDTGRLYSIGTNDIDRKKMFERYIAKPIVWRILQEVYLPVSMLSMLINHDKTTNLNALLLP